MPTVADIVRRYGDAYAAEGRAVSTAQRRVLQAIGRCRTAALGGHVERCDQCGHTRVWYTSCRNRHGPPCPSLARAAWIEARTADLLDTESFHVVFTVPQEIAVIALQNNAVVYGLLFRAAADTLRTIAADPQHLGAAIGFCAVLHTWGQTLVHHPHLHCVVPGGGPSLDGTRWIACRPGFFLPVHVLSRLFRRRFLTALQGAFDAGELRFGASLDGVRDRSAFLQHLAPARQVDWVVYAKRPVAGPQQVLDYVGRYTHRIAISNARVIDIEDGQGRFRDTDYRDGSSHPRTMTFAAGEFLHRLLLHVLPPGFHRIRSYGWLGNRHRFEKLTQCRQLLGSSTPDTPAAPDPIDYRDRYEALTGRSLRACPRCRSGTRCVLDRVDALHQGGRFLDASCVVSPRSARDLTHVHRRLTTRLPAASFRRRADGPLPRAVAAAAARTLPASTQPPPYRSRRRPLQTCNPHSRIELRFRPTRPLRTAATVSTSPQSGMVAAAALRKKRSAFSDPPAAPISLTRGPDP